MRLTGITLILAPLVLLLAACSGGGDDGPKATPTPKTPGPEEVLGEYLRANRNVGYVPYCTEADRGTDVGKLCASFRGERGTRRAYDIGPTFSEPTGLAILEQAGDGTWSVLSVANRDPSAPGIPGIPWPLQAGDAVVVIGLGDECLRIREQPTQEATSLICMPDGTAAIVQEGPVEAETFTWWRIAGEGFNGWAAGTWLRLQDAIAEALNPPAAATPE